MAYSSSLTDLELILRHIKNGCPHEGPRSNHKSDAHKQGGTKEMWNELAVKVPVDVLTARITQNRNEHRRLFEEAITGFRQRAIEELDGRIAKLKEGKVPALTIGLPVPRDHSEDYDAILDMLGAHSEEVIEFPESEYRKYMRDEWNWKNEFLATSSLYTEVAGHDE